MKTEILNQIQEWLKPYKAQMEARQKALLTQTLKGGGSSASLMQTLLGGTSGTASINPADLEKDFQLRGVFMRIKSANLSRGQRDSLSGLVRQLAADDRLDTRTTLKVFQMVSVMEITSRREPRGTSLLGSAERTVDEEISWVKNRQTEAAAQRSRLDSLQSKFSALA